jgi:two-component system OmpR family response regulator/two-component system response regulator RstA
MTFQEKHNIANYSLLLVEDDQRLSNLIANYLEKHGFVVGVESRGDTAVSRIIKEQPHIVILDLMLPGLGGMDVCKQVRQDYKGSILMLTAIDEDIEQIVGLEIGADDYVTKPIEPRVLLARIKALIRHSGKNNLPQAPISTDVININIEGTIISINAGSRELHIANNSIKLTTSEFDLLWLLADNAGTIFSRDDLYLKLNGFPYDGIDRSMDIRISKLRKCLNDNPDEPALIKTVRGRGYLFTTSHTK